MDGWVIFIGSLDNGNGMKKEKKKQDAVDLVLCWFQVNSIGSYCRPMLFQRSGVVDSSLSLNLTTVDRQTEREFQVLDNDSEQPC